MFILYSECFHILESLIAASSHLDVLRHNYISLKINKIDLIWYIRIPQEICCNQVFESFDVHMHNNWVLKHFLARFSICYDTLIRAVERVTLIRFLLSKHPYYQH